MGYSPQQFIDETADEKLLSRVIGLGEKYSTEWIRFSNYEIKSKKDLSRGSQILYIKPDLSSGFEIYDPFDCAEQLLVDTLRLGGSYDAYRKEMKEVDLNAYRKRKTNKMWSDLLDQVLEYVKNYGLMGFMSSNTHNRNVLGDNEILISEKNEIALDKRIMDEKTYMDLFTPFVEPGDLKVSAYKDNIYLAKYDDTPQYYGKRPVVMDLIFSSYYCERVEWILNYASMLSKHYDQLMVYKKSANNLTEPVTILADAFQAGKIGFTITQGKDTQIAWDFDSLKTTIQTLYAFAVTNSNSILRRCVHCSGFYIANSKKEKYCGSACRNRHNVMKSRKRIKDEDTDS